MRDIENRADVITFVDAFYKQVLKDEHIAHFFTTVVAIDFEKHMPKMYDFWSTMLLGESSYKSNPMTAHLDLHKLSPLESSHFERWKDLFFSTLDERFSGPKVEEAKQRATHMSALMLFKAESSEKPGFIQ